MFAGLFTAIHVNRYFGYTRLSKKLVGTGTKQPVWGDPPSPYISTSSSSSSSSMASSMAGRLTCSGIDALPSFPGGSTVSSSSRFLAEGVFRDSGVVHSFKVVDPVLFVFESHVLYSRDLSLFPYKFASYFILSCVSRNSS